MASADDEEWYLRLSLLMYKVATPVFRAVLDHTIDVKTSFLFDQLLYSNFKNLQKLRGKVITPEQWSLLYPKGTAITTASTADLDLTLMMILVRSLKDGGKDIFISPPTGWTVDTLSKTDITPEADLLRIKHNRNIVAHKSTAITKPQFDQIVIDMTSVTGRLENHLARSKYHQTWLKDLYEVAHGPLDREAAKLQADILAEKWKEEKAMKEVLQNIGGEVQQIGTQILNIEQHFDQYGEDIKYVKYEILQTTTSTVALQQSVAHIEQRFDQRFDQSSAAITAAVEESGEKTIQTIEKYLKRSSPETQSLILQDTYAPVSKRWEKQLLNIRNQVKENKESARCRCIGVNQTYFIPDDQLIAW